MNFTDYQSKSRTTAKYPPIGHPVIYPTLGLTNEAGEVAGKIKKIFRDKGGVIGEAEREALKGELGDVLWYLAQLCTELDLSLDDGTRQDRRGWRQPLSRPPVRFKHD
jgi:NTP pyrophosphatase (non-canonical NTP hydrolase)